MAFEPGERSYEVVQVTMPLLLLGLIELHGFDFQWYVLWNENHLLSDSGSQLLHRAQSDSATAERCLYSCTTTQNNNPNSIQRVKEEARALAWHMQLRVVQCFCCCLQRSYQLQGHGWVYTLMGPPGAVAYDATGRYAYIADPSNHRVLMVDLNCV